MGCSPCKDGDSITNPQLIIISNTATINNSQKVPPEDKKKIDEKNENKLIDLVIKDKRKIINSNITSKYKNNYIVKQHKKDPILETIEKLKNHKIKTLNLSTLELFNSRVITKLSHILLDYTHIEEINLSACKMMSIPSNLPINLKKLIVKENYLNELELPLLPNLSHLDASYNKIQLIPSNLSPMLEILILNNNKITDINYLILKNIISLQELNLAGNQITDIMLPFKDLPFLIVLNLTFNLIKNLQDNFFSRCSLRCLYLRNNPLLDLNPRIGLMNSLYKLDLRSTKITKLPSSLIKITSLEHLILDDLLLIFPPMHIINRGLECIKTYLAGNQEIYPIDLFESDSEKEKIEEIEEIEKNSKESCYQHHITISQSSILLNRKSHSSKDLHKMSSSHSIKD